MNNDSQNTNGGGEALTAELISKMVVPSEIFAVAHRFYMLDKEAYAAIVCRLALGFAHLDREQTEAFRDLEQNCYDSMEEALDADDLAEVRQSIAEASEELSFQPSETIEGKVQNDIVLANALGICARECDPGYAVMRAAQLISVGVSPVIYAGILVIFLMQGEEEDDTFGTLAMRALEAFSEDVSESLVPQGAGDDEDAEATIELESSSMQEFVEEYGRELAGALVGEENVLDADEADRDEGYGTVIELNGRRYVNKE
jgi:hypothetical protein